MQWNLEREKPQQTGNKTCILPNEVSLVEETPFTYCGTDMIEISFFIDVSSEKKSKWLLSRH